MKKIAITFLLMCVAPASAMACWVCNTPASARQAFRSHSIVFVGTVESNNREIVRFSVKEVFAGDLGAEVEMNAGLSDCDFHFKAGETYLVYTGMDTKGLLASAHLCSRTMELNHAEADLKYLRSNARRNRTAR